jgi:hypothetical protein
MIIDKPKYVVTRQTIMRVYVRYKIIQYYDSDSKWA